MNTNIADTSWGRRGLYLRQIDSSLLCPEGTYVYLNCTVGHRVVTGYDICLNESEVSCWVRTAGSVICCTSRLVKENWCYGEKGVHGSLVYCQRLFICCGYGTGALIV